MGTPVCVFFYCSVCSAVNDHEKKAGQTQDVTHFQAYLLLGPDLDKKVAGGKCGCEGVFLTWAV